MEENTIIIEMKGPSPVRRVLKSWSFWAFIACALLVAVCEAIDGSWICVLWIVVAATYQFFANLFKAYSDDFHELSIDLIKEREILLDALKEQARKAGEEKLKRMEDKV